MNYSAYAHSPVPDLSFDPNPVTQFQYCHLQPPIKTAPHIGTPEAHPGIVPADIGEDE
jgi:hypothetical protein